jgi:hypothetical protein
MSDLEQKVGNSCIKGKYLKDLDESQGRHEPPILPDCGTFCEIEFADIIDSNTDKIMNGTLNINDI